MDIMTGRSHENIATTDSESQHEDPPLRSLAMDSGLWLSDLQGDRYCTDDIYKVKDHVKVGYDDIFWEPSALRTGDIGQTLSPHVRKAFTLVFIYTQAAIYYFMTIVTGMFLGVFWGVLFGGLNYVVVWVVQPVMKLLFVSLRLVAMPTRAVVRAFLDPFFQSLGQIFTSVSVRCRVRAIGTECLDMARDSPRKQLHVGLHPSNSRLLVEKSTYPQEWLGFV